MDKKDLEKNLARMESARLETARVAVWLSTLIIDDKDYNNAHYYRLRDRANKAYDNIKETHRLLKLETYGPKDT